MRPTAGEIAQRFDARLNRRLSRWLARAAARMPGFERLPWRLRERVGDAPPRIGVRLVRATEASGAAARARVLLISHDLSASGAPRVLCDIARMLHAAGMAVTVLAPRDGPLAETLTAAGIELVIDPACLAPDAPLLKALSPHVDGAICNTVETAPAVAGLAVHVPVLWYIHEVSLLRDRLDRGEIDGAVAGAARLWAGSELAAVILRERRGDVTVRPYGLDPLGQAPPPGGEGSAPLRIALFGSYEPRKGQDLAVRAVGLLSPALRAQLRLTLHGRVLDAPFFAALERAVAALPDVSLAGELDAEGYRDAVLASDAVLVASRDDTLPLVSLDALGAGRVLICTATTGTSAYLTPGNNGFVADTPTAEAISATLAAASARRGEWPEIGAAGRAAFDRSFSKPSYAAAVVDAVETLVRSGRDRRPG